ncbi:unnamed protein product [Prunus armeniaca]
MQVESEPILVQGQEDWIEDYEEEQLDYEPYADDQIGLLELENWTEEYGEKQMEYDGELDEEIEGSRRTRKHFGRRRVLPGKL